MADLHYRGSWSWLPPLLHNWVRVSDVNAVFGIATMVIAVCRRALKVFKLAVQPLYGGRVRVFNHTDDVVHSGSWVTFRPSAAMDGACLLGGASGQNFLLHNSPVFLVAHFHKRHHRWRAVSVPSPAYTYWFPKGVSASACTRGGARPAFSVAGSLGVLLWGLHARFT